MILVLQFWDLSQLTLDSDELHFNGCKGLEMNKKIEQGVQTDRLMGLIKHTKALFYILYLHANNDELKLVFLYK
jgi:hypothetical protein